MQPGMRVAARPPPGPTRVRMFHVKRHRVDVVLTGPRHRHGRTVGPNRLPLPRGGGSTWNITADTSALWMVMSVRHLGSGDAYRASPSSETFHVRHHSVSPRQSRAGASLRAPRRVEPPAAPRPRHGMFHVKHPLQLRGSLPLVRPHGDPCSALRVPTRVLMFHVKRSIPQHPCRHGFCLQGFRQATASTSNPPSSPVMFHVKHWLFMRQMRPCDQLPEHHRPSSRRQQPCDRPTVDDA